MGGLKQSLLQCSTYSLEENFATQNMGVPYLQVLPIYWHI